MGRSSARAYRRNAATVAAVGLAAALIATAVGGEARAQGGFGGERCALAELDRHTATSGDCAACHDGRRAPRAGPRAGQHPVDIDYDHVRATSSRRLRSRAEVEGRGILLPAGKVTCTTCHDGRSRLPFQLAAPMEGPLERRLCDACHVVGG